MEQCFTVCWFSFLSHQSSQNLIMPKGFEHVETWKRAEPVRLNSHGSLWSTKKRWYALALWNISSHAGMVVVYRFLFSMWKLLLEPSWSLRVGKPWLEARETLGNKYSLCYICWIQARCLPSSFLCKQLANKWYTTNINHYNTTTQMSKT